MTRGEFDLIARYFAPLSDASGLNLQDDAAVLQPPAGQELVVTKDLMIEGVHFRASDGPGVAAQRLLRTNLSDLAAMGAQPVGVLLGLALKAPLDEAWITGLASALGADLREFDCTLLGGDTTTGAQTTVLSLTALGYVPSGQALERGGARPGDLVFCSGVIGDGYLGLHAGEDDWPDHPTLIARFQKPQPRLALGTRLRGVASSATDVSDGLLADLGHIAKASRCLIEVDAAAVPLSDAAIDYVGHHPHKLITLVTGGDDYELVFTISPSMQGKLTSIATDLGLKVTCIGRVLEGNPGVTLKDRDGRAINVGQAGYEHR